MKYGTHSALYKSGNFKEVTARAAEDGCEGLEVSLPVDGLRTGKCGKDELERSAEEIAEHMKDAGLGVISFTSGLMMKHAEFPEMAEFAFKLADILKTRDMRIFSSPFVRLGGPGSVLEDWKEEYDGTRGFHELYEKDCRNFEQLAAMAEKHDKRWCIELHHGFVINSCSAAWNFLKCYGPKHAGVLHDPGNMVFEGCEGWRMGITMLGDYLAYMHCKNSCWEKDAGGEWKQVMSSLEEGIADYGEIMTALKDTGFEGYLSIEDLRKDLPPERKIKPGIDYLKGLEKSPERKMPA